MSEGSLDAAALDRLRRIGGANLAREMVELYLKNGPERIRSITEGAAAGDADRVSRGAHTMKSSAGNVGAIRLQHAADVLEEAAAGGTIDDEMVARVVREYDDSAAALRLVLEEATS